METWVTRFEKRREEFIEAVGGTAVDLNGLIGALLPFILVLALLQTVIFLDIIPDQYARFVASLIVASAIEFYAIATMILSHRIESFNATLREGEPPIRFNDRSAKASYLWLVMLIVFIGHILPQLFGLPSKYALLATPFLILIAWNCYQMYGANLAWKERSRARARAIEDDRLDKATQAFADRGKATAEAELLREQRLLEEARARQDEAKAVQAKAQVALVREERRKAQAEPQYSPFTVKPTPNSALSFDNKPANGNTKPWDEKSFQEISLALAEGFEPPRIEHLPTYQRYAQLVDELGMGVQFDIKAAELVGVNQVRFRKDLKLLAAHRLVKEVARGIYVLVEPIIFDKQV